MFAASELPSASVPSRDILFPPSVPAGTAQNASISSHSSEPRAPANTPILGRLPSLSAPFL